MKGERIARILKEIQEYKGLKPECKKCLGCTALEDMDFRGDIDCSGMSEEQYKRAFQEHIGDIRKTLSAEKKPEEPAKTTYLERLKQNRQT
jgi:hypothetical protein